MGKMQLHFLPGHRRVTISTSGCLPEIVKAQGGGSGKTPNHWRISCCSMLSTAFLLMIIVPFLFFRTAFLALDGATRCPSLGGPQCFLQMNDAWLSIPWTVVVP